MPGDARIFQPWPFTGRRSEVAAVVAAWQAGRGLALVGAHGSGRTRLAERASARLGVPLLEALQWQPGRGRAILDEAEHLPHGARRAALELGCLLVLPSWLAPEALDDAVRLPPLDAAEVSTVLHRVLGQPVGAATVAHLALASRGNMRSLVELARGSCEAGVLELVDGTWQLVGDPRPTGLLVERVEHALSQLDGPQREGVELVALGEPLPRQWLADQRPEAVAGVLACPLVCGVDTIQMRDEVSRDAVLAAMPSLRTRRLARLLRDSPLGDPAARAAWAHAAGAVVDPDGALAATAQLLGRGRADRAAALLEATEPDPRVALARAALLVHEGRAAEIPAVGPAGRLAAARHLVGGLPPDGPSRVAQRESWPATGLAWDPFPAGIVVDAVLAARSSDLVPATAAARRALGLASSGWAPDLAWAALALGWVALAAGKPVTARRRGLDLAAAAGQLGWPPMAAMGRNMVAVADVWAGRAGRPDADGAEPGDPVLAGWSRLWLVRASAWSTLASGRPDVGGLADAAHAACDLGDLVTGLELASDLRRLGEPGRARDVLERCRSGPAAVTAELAAAQAALTGDPQRWAEAAEAFSQLGARGRAAECLVQWAEALGGRSRAAGRARADEALAACEGLRTPLAHRTHASGLTAREREVAVLAADGVPSSRIAERLGISTRTVDNLLARCYTKLQVAGRRELPEAMGLGGGQL